MNQPTAHTQTGEFAEGGFVAVPVCFIDRGQVTHIMVHATHDM